MDLGVHLPLLQFGSDELSLGRLTGTVDAARDCGFAAISANDHLLFSAPWLDGPSALASVIDRSGELTIATTVFLTVVRQSVALAKTLAALDVLSEGRLVAAVGPGSSKADYDAVGIPFDERWKRFDEAVAELRALLDPSESALAPGPWRGRSIPLWIGSWGSKAGLRRIARAADGWLASAYNTTPERFAVARQDLANELAERGRQPDGFPNALATMWTWVTEDRAEGDRMLEQVLAPLLKREPDELRERVCVGSAEHCAELLTRFAEAGCERVYVWPLGDERRQLELVAGEVATRIAAT